MSTNNLIGKVLGQRYEIIEQIGEGGMAIVYKARCKMLNRNVAVKVLKDEYKVDDEILKKFNRESQAAASLSHSNIVSVYDVGNDDGNYYIVMELVDGITLKDYINKNPRMNWRMALRFSMQICSALSHAHRNGIIHRDIKPHNIIISQDGNCKVADFGIASVANLNETRKVDEGILGSVHYISPEHAKGVIPDERSDIYSLGVTMYEMLTGKLPFDGDSAVSIAVMHINQKPTPIRDINIVVPLALSQIVDKAMAKDIKLRYQSADEMYRNMYDLSNDPDIFSAYADSETDIPDMSKTRKISKEETEEIKKISDEPKEIEIEVKKPVVVKKKSVVDKIKDLFTAENKKDKVAVIAAIITSVIILAAVAFVAVDMLWPGALNNLFSFESREFVIPDFKGKTLEELKEEYKNKKIEFIVDEEVYNEDYDNNQVISHEPLEGMNVKLPIKVHLVISKGTKEIKLSRYIDKEYKQAEAELKNLGLKCVLVEEFDEEIPEGYVISQDPKPDTIVEAGSIVTLAVSKGADDELIKVPNMVGMKEADAKSKLSDLNLTLGGIIRTKSNKPEGIVIDQSVPEGSELTKKSKITLTISNGIKPSDEDEPSGNNGGGDSTVTNDSKSYVLTLELPTSKESVNVVVKQDNKSVYNKTLNTDVRTVNVTLKGSGKSSVAVYYDGVLFYTKTINF